MAQCECGRAIGTTGKLCARCDALRTLGLERGASRNEIRDAYRDLVKVWHPDRFSNDGKLRSRAEEKLKEVNAAFQHLNSSADRTPARAASATKKPETKTETQTPYWTSRTCNANLPVVFNICKTDSSIERIGTRTSSEGCFCAGLSQCRSSSVEWQCPNAVPNSRGESRHQCGISAPEFIRGYDPCTCGFCHKRA